jgi:signal peptidase I
MTTPPPLPVPFPRRCSTEALWKKTVIGLCLFSALIGTTLLLLRLTSGLRCFFVPTNSMAPAVVAGDNIIMDGVSFWFREPRRGDIAIFKTGDIPRWPDNIFAQRIAGLPGDKIKISAGSLFINGRQVFLHNRDGNIIYTLPDQQPDARSFTETTVPPDCYFMLGDNSANSFDSRYRGVVPRRAIMGRAIYCYYPLARTGVIQ